MQTAIHTSSGQLPPTSTISKDLSFVCHHKLIVCRFAFTELIRKLGWNKVAAITQAGEKYTDYMSALQDTFQEHGINFVLNRKFPPNALDLELVNSLLQDLLCINIESDNFSICKTSRTEGQK